MSPWDVLIWGGAIAGAIATVALSMWGYYRLRLLIFDINVLFENRRTAVATARQEHQKVADKREQEHLQALGNITQLKKELVTRERELSEAKSQEAGKIITGLKSDIEKLKTSESSLQHQVRVLTKAGGEDPRLNPDGIAALVVEKLAGALPQPEAPVVDTDAVASAVASSLLNSPAFDGETLAARVVAQVTPALTSTLEGIERGLGDQMEMVRSATVEAHGSVAQQSQALSAVHDEMGGLRQEVRSLVVTATTDLAGAINSLGDALAQRMSESATAGNGQAAPIDLNALRDELVPALRMVVEDALSSLLANLSETGALTLSTGYNANATAGAGARVAAAGGTSEGGLPAARIQAEPVGSPPQAGVPARDPSVRPAPTLPPADEVASGSLISDGDVESPEGPSVGAKTPSAAEPGGEHPFRGQVSITVPAGKPRPRL